MNAFDENHNYLGFTILAINDNGIWYSNGHSQPYVLQNGYRIRPGYIIMTKEHDNKTFQSLIDDFSGNWRQSNIKYLGVNFRYVARNKELICDFEEFFQPSLRTATIET